MTLPIPIQILIAVFSGLIGSLTTLFYQRHLDTLKMKRNVVEELFAYKYQLTNAKSQAEKSDDSQGFIKAMNSIPIVFNGNKNVLQEYDKFYNAVSSSNRDNKQVDNALLNLLKELCKAAKLKCSDWNDDRFTRTFNI